jgi:hypothetical protein
MKLVFRDGERWCHSLLLCSMSPFLKKLLQAALSPGSPVLVFVVRCLFASGNAATEANIGWCELCDGGGGEGDKKREEKKRKRKYKGLSEG